MTTRVIVAVIAIPILVLITILAPAWLLALIVGIAAACCAWELLRCTGRAANVRIPFYIVIPAFFIPFFSAFFDGQRVFLISLFFLFAVMCCEMMLSFRKQNVMDFETVAVVTMGGAVFPLLLAGVVRLALREDCGNVYALLPFVIVFSSDGGGYFAGLALGRRQLTPRLSPHKTLEGSIGAFLLAIILTLVYGLILKGAGYEVGMAAMGAYAFLGSLAAQLGDLCFSAVKRLNGVKDYGKLIPGHGGMLDRMDSMIWAAALLDILAAWAPAIAVK